MREIVLFVEDFAHRQIIGPLVERIAGEQDVAMRLDWRSAVRGHGQVARELGDYLRDVGRQGEPWPHLIVVANRRRNCKGLNERGKEIERCIGQAPAPVVLAVPDPHVERWLLLDGAAFKAVFGQGLRRAGSEVRPRPLQAASHRSHPRDGCDAEPGRCRICGGHSVEDGRRACEAGGQVLRALRG